MPTRSSRCQKWKKKTQNKKREKEEDKKSFFSGTFETNKIQEEHLGFFSSVRRKSFGAPRVALSPKISSAFFRLLWWRRRSVECGMLGTLSERYSWLSDFIMKIPICYALVNNNYHSSSFIIIFHRFALLHHSLRVLKKVTTLFFSLLEREVKNTNSPSPSSSASCSIRPEDDSMTTQKSSKMITFCA